MLAGRTARHQPASRRDASSNSTAPAAPTMDLSDSRGAHGQVIIEALIDSRVFINESRRSPPSCSHTSVPAAIPATAVSVESGAPIRTRSRRSARPQRRRSRRILLTRLGVPPTQMIKPW